MRVHRAIAALVCAAIVPSAAAWGENWPQWRGPHFNGSSTEKGLPVKWTATENVAWTADLPGVGGSTPIVWDDHVFVSAMDPKTRKMHAVCLNRDDGRPRWDHVVGDGFANYRGNTAASPSPITDGKTAWFLFGTGDLLAFDMGGKELWRRNLQKDHGRFELLWEYGASALLYKDKLYVPVLHGDHTRQTVPPSYLLAIDPRTGKDLWKHIRPTAASLESRQAYTTPIPMETAQGAHILLMGGDCLTAHDAETGREVWRSDSYNPTKNAWWRVVPSPVAAGDVAVGCAPKGGEMFAVKAGRTGQLARTDRAWTTSYDSPDVATPLYYDGKLFVLNGDSKVLVRMVPRTGEVVWKGRLGGRGVFQASPTGADGRIYCLNMNGEVVVVSAGETFEVLHRTEMGGSGVRSSIAVAGGQLFIRTDTKLYCIGKRRPIGQD